MRRELFLVCAGGHQKSHRNLWPHRYSHKQRRDSFRKKHLTKHPLGHRKNHRSEHDSPFLDSQDRVANDDGEGFRPYCHYRVHRGMGGSEWTGRLLCIEIRSRGIRRILEIRTTRHAQANQDNLHLPIFHKHRNVRWGE